MNETALRAEIVRVCRAMSARGLSPGTSGNLSVRVPGGMLVTPSAVPYDRLRPEQVVWMRLDGGAAPGPLRPSSEWRIHAEILRARPDAAAVLHAHPMFCTTLACLGREIPAFHYMVALAGGATIRCAPYATFGTPELAAHAVAALDGRRACLLANHGLVVLGGSPSDALELAAEVETLAAQYCRTLQVGEPRILPDEEMDRVLARFRDYRPPVAGAAEPDVDAMAPAAADRAAPAPSTDRPDRPAAAALPSSGAAREGAGTGWWGAWAARRFGGISPTGARASPIDWGEVGPRWVGRIGAVLLLLGLAYLMKFAVDQGWVGPPLRVALGAATGLALLAAGLRLETGRRMYGVTLLGTGVATLYLTGYAAYALYGYLGPRVAFAALVAIIALALVLARRREEQVLAQLGAAGAFAAPVLLGEAGSTAGLSLYVVAVASWTGALAYLHRWRSLFLTILVGAFGVLALGVDQAPVGVAAPLTLAGAWAWGVVVLLPLLGERLGGGEGRPPREVPWLLRWAIADPRQADHMLVAFLLPVATALLVALSTAVWELGRAGAAAVAFAALLPPALLLAGTPGPGRERTRAVAAAPLLVVFLAASLLFPDEAASVALLAAGGVTAFLAPGVRGQPGSAQLGHIAFALLGAWIAAQLADSGRPSGFATPLAVAELAAVLVAAAVAVKALPPVERRVYLAASHAAVLLWVVVCARGLPGALALVSALWGGYGAVLMVVAVRRRLPAVRLAALATLGLVAAKLLLIDTAGVDAGWRIVLFLGSGAGFLALGYLSSADETDPGTHEERPEGGGR